MDNQSPYVHIFRSFKVESGAGASLKGDVQPVVDDIISKRVLRVSGAVPTAGYIMIPKGRTGNAGLTGRFLYLEIRIELGEKSHRNILSCLPSPVPQPPQIITHPTHLVSLPHTHTPSPARPAQTSPS